MAASQFNILPTDSTASVFDVVKRLSTLDQLAIIRPNNPPPGISGYIFDLTGDELWEQESEITDHFLEDNTAIQDHWALKPEKYTVHGLVAEFTDAGVAASGPVAASLNALPSNPDLAPQQSASTSAYQESYALGKAGANKVATGAPNQRSLFGLYQNTAGKPPNQRRQTAAFLYFVQLMKGRQLCSVQTAWGIENNMAVMVHRAEQPKETRDQTDFTLTFKKLKFVAEVQVVSGGAAGRLADQNAPTTELGIPAQSPVSDSDQQSILYRLSHP